MKLAIVLLALLAALVAVNGETKGTTTTTVVGAASSPVSVNTITTTSGTTTATLPNVTSGVTISSTGATGSFVGQPTIKGDGGGTVTIGTTTATATSTAAASPAASGAATIVGAAGGATSPSVALSSASPAASGAAVITVISASPVRTASPAVSRTASPAASGAASPAASGAAVITVVSASPAVSGAASPAVSGAASPAASGAASPAASGAASPAASGAASPAASGAVSPAASGAASPAASGAASPAASGAASPAASGAASPAASGAASPAASGAASPAASPAASGAASPAASPTGVFGSPSPSVLASAAYPPMPSYGEENFQFTCPNATVESMVEVSFEPLLIGINAVSSIKFAGCPSLMYVATRAGQVFEVTINNATSAVEQVRLILDLRSEIVTSSSQAGAGAAGAGAGAGAGASASSSSSAGSSSTSGSASASSNAADQPGLLGMAFPPDFADTGLFYLYFSARSSAGGAGGAVQASPAASATTSNAVCGDESSMLDHVNRLAEYRLDSTSGIANFSRTLLEVRWPFANGNSDNSLEFAPNSMLLFLGVGDGGSSFDPFENAQNPDILLGKVHVIDLSSLSSNASCNTSVLRLSELASNCSDIAAAITTFATGMHVPAGFEFLNPSAELEGSSCPSGANATAGGANATAGGANATATAAGGANTTTSNNATQAGGMNLTLSDLAPRLIAPDRGQGMYDEINIMEEIGANYGWDIMEGWTCINQSLELCPDVTSELLNASLSGGGANATASSNITAGGANATASANATTAGGANQTTSANATASTMGVLPAAVIPHNCRRLYNPQAILGGRLYRGSELDPMLQGAYIFGATTSLQNGNESLPTGNGALFFMRPESFSGNAVVDLTMCPAATNETAGGAGQNASMAGNETAAGASNATNANMNATSSSNASLSDVTVTGSGVNVSFIPNSRLEVFPVTINYQFFPAQHFFSAMGADASRTQLFVGVSSVASPTGGVGGVFRLIPFNEGTQNPAIIPATNLRPGQIVFSAANATANNNNSTANATTSA